MGYEVLAAVRTLTTVFWIVTSCSLDGAYQRHEQGDRKR